LISGTTGGEYPESHKSTGFINFVMEDCEIEGNGFYIGIRGMGEGKFSFDRVKFGNSIYSVIWGTDTPNSSSKIVVKNSFLPITFHFLFNEVQIDNCEGPSFGSAGEGWILEGERISLNGCNLTVGLMNYGQRDLIDILANDVIVTNNTFYGERTTTSTNHMPIIMRIRAESVSGFKRATVEGNNMTVIYPYTNYTVSAPNTYYEMQTGGGVNWAGAIGIALFSYLGGSLKNISIKSNTINFICTDNGTDPTNWPKNTGIFVKDIDEAAIKDNIITLNGNAKDYGIVLYSASNNLVEGNRVTNAGSGNKYVEVSSSGNSNSLGTALPAGNL